MNNLEPPPTSRLPPIKALRISTAESLDSALTYLRLRYNPEVRGTKRTSRKVSLDGHEPSDDFDDLHGSDDFERSYALRWLTCLIAQLDDTGDDQEAANETAIPLDRREILIQEAASLLALCSGTAGAGSFIREFNFATSSHSSPPSPATEAVGTIQIQLRDVPLDNHDYGSVGAQTWGGACVLSAEIAENPSKFGLLSSCDQLRVLELGAGTGLVSLTIAKLLEQRVKKAFILASDFFPSVLSNLKSNIHLNFPDLQPSDPTQVEAGFLDWSQYQSMLSAGQHPPFDQPFDLIVGADIIYEDKHAEWIKQCLEILLKKPSAGGHAPAPKFYLVIPLRHTHENESHSVEVVFPWADDRVEGEKRLCILHKEIISCDGRSGNERPGNAKEEVEYAYYHIGWY
ncbi:hypothetical protein PLEOSDRAFT_1074207 [Pleurotus ostreatus PC15]|uniref:FAM86 N-terminal domain-containing protein n=1 Tax=Pleurotus ostreatus (strain PC15) TaxID=1137138 RepID=A0A067NUB2_PLEO1|nr:hypothetical protein PLEOSDRAFT_1074207 [Pleurotus ostreatus PC15]